MFFNIFARCTFIVTNKQVIRNRKEQALYIL